MPFLAKISIIEEEYPEFHKQLVEDPYLLDDINSYFKKELTDDEKEKRVEDILEVDENEPKESRLKSFLSSTQRVTTANIRPFLNLSDQSYSSGLEDFDEVMRFLKTGQQSELLDRIKDIREKGGSFDQYCDAIDDELQTYQSISRDQPMYAIINSLVNVFDRLEEEEQNEVSRVVGRYLTREPGRQFLKYLDASSVSYTHL
ncbi:KAP P-loop domain protein [Haloferax gibbonsii ATCC 33959]|uniref:KAP P-loop domain protein n=2 Tax=Haloferax gibbonsii TaxID=35746 RepID=M0H6P1_HALGM|nr:KAP P-loop domain protein [Haloferax gibbonsii ATCC 33959]